MVDKKKVMSDLDKVGQLLEATRKAGHRLTAEQTQEAKRVLTTTASELFRLKARNMAEMKAQQTKRSAITKSASENLITEADSRTELRTVSSASFASRVRARRIQQSLDAVKSLASEVSKLAAAPELEKLEKGHSSSDAIKPPQTAKAGLLDREAIRKRLAERRKQAGELGKSDTGTVPVNRPPQKGMAPGMPPQFPQAGNVEELETGAPKSSQQPVAPAAGIPASPAVAASKARARNLYTRAMALVKEAATEKDPAVKAKKTRTAATLERLADQLVQPRQPKQASKTTDIRARIAARKATASDKSAATAVYAANDRVLLADGSIGTISSVNGENLKVSVAGVEKDVLSSTVKRISTINKKAESDVSVKADEKNVTIKIPTEKVEQAVEKVEEKAEGKDKPEPKAAPKAEPKEKPEAPKAEPKMEVGSSVADRVRAGIALVRGGKKTAAEAPAAPAEAPKGPEPKAAPAGDSGTVGKSFTMTYAPSASGKFNVQISETEIVECDSEEEAKALIARGSKVQATAKTPDSPTDSATTKKPDASADVSKTLKGLDQAGKGYSSTTKDQVTDAQMSMLKKGTAKTPDSPTDSATTKKPDASANVSQTLKGLDQAGKGYGSTGKDQKVDPQFSMVKKSDLEIKAKILADSNRKQAERLAVVEAQVLADRAVKVGAIAEEQRSEQQTVLAELYKESPAEFKAYGRLIASLEANKGTGPSLANRSVRKVEAAISRRNSEVVDGSRSVTGSLEDGTFFEDEQQQ